MGLEKIDIELWKEIQDKFSRQIGLPILTVDSNGKEIAVSGELPFYSQLIKSKRNELYYSQNGLLNIKRQLILHGESAGSIVCGPIGFDEGFDIESFAEELGIDKEELVDASKEIKQIENDKIEHYKKFISLLADILPNLAYQTKKKDKEIMELKTLYNVIQKVNSSLEIEDILNYIMKFLVTSLNATDCSVFVYDEEGEKKYTLKKDAEKMAEIEKEAAKKALEGKKPIVIKDVRAMFKADVEYNYNSMFVVPLKLRNKPIGTISLYDKSANFKEEDVNFISVIADQIAIAIANAKRYGEFKELAVVDRLTGAFNRRHFMELLETALKEKISLENPISLILLDVDSFGKYNNTHGHPRGDELLRELSVIIKEVLGEIGSIGRYGGEEFIILLPKLNTHESLEIAEKIRNLVEDHGFYGRETQPNGKVTISIGLVCCRINLSAKELIREADEAVYRAKNTGRNKVAQKIILANNLKAEI